MWECWDNLPTTDFIGGNKTYSRIFVKGSKRETQVLYGNGPKAQVSLVWSPADDHFKVSLRDIGTPAFPVSLLDPWLPWGEQLSPLLSSAIMSYCLTQAQRHSQEAMQWNLRDHSSFSVIRGILSQKGKLRLVKRLLISTKVEDFALLVG